MASDNWICNHCAQPITLVGEGRTRQYWCAHCEVMRRRQDVSSPAEMERIERELFPPEEVTEDVTVAGVERMEEGVDVTGDVTVTPLENRTPARGEMNNVTSGEMNNVTTETKPVTDDEMNNVTTETKPVTPVTQPVTKHCPTCTCGKVYPTNAARQKAYRDRRKEAPSG